MQNISLKQIEEEIHSSLPEAWPALMEKYSSDMRAGVKKAMMRLGRKHEAYLLEQKRLDNMKAVEKDLYGRGYKLIAATDEVGRGPLCGPVVSACVVMPENSRILYVNDSKQLSEKKRRKLYDKILAEALHVGIGFVDNETIDRINILNATKLSMKTALEKLEVKPDILLLDALKIDADIEQLSYIKGDATVYSIAAASIVAKVVRDELMDDYDKIYPGYELSANKGYGTQKHIDAIKEKGLSPIHRRSFLNGILNDTTRKNGQINKDRAAKYLCSRGMKLIETNYTTANGEIDLILSENGTIVFCEVKAAKYVKGTTPFARIDEKKRLRICTAAEKYLNEKGKTGAEIRYDAVAVELMDDGCYKIKHIRNAFEPVNIYC